MRRERALKVVLVVVGLLFSAGVLPVMDSLSHQNQSMYAFDMMLSLYVALGVFLLIAARNASANRLLAPQLGRLPPAPRGCGTL